MAKEWMLRAVDDSIIESLCQSSGVSPLLARLLAIRNIQTESAARHFFNPCEQTFSDPFLFSEIEPAIARILQARDKKERVLIYGDYDVDGITSTCIMLETMWDLGIEADYYLPDRLAEGYGLQPEPMAQFAKEFQLLVTVDCGTTAVEAVKEANKHQMDVIITDHHDPGDERPPAVAVLNPIRLGETFPNKHLSGAGVAWTFSKALRQKAGLNSDETHLLEIAAMGMVADVMPLTGENRAMITQALRLFAKTERPGLVALMELAKVNPSQISAADIGYRIGPRINASSRMEHPKHALELLLTKEESHAWELARYLQQLNAKRQNVERNIFKEACKQVEDEGLANRSDRLLFVVGKDWPRGVVGIVAQKMMNRYGRPSFLLSIEPDNVAHGSARSVDSADLIPLLNHARPHSISCGGHSCAAGMKVESHNLEKFENALHEAAQENWSEIKSPPLWLDAKVKLEQLDFDFIHEIERLEPYGHGNEEPVFYAAGSLDGYGARIVGNNHLRLSMRHPRGSISAIGFGQGEKLERLNGGEIEAAFRCNINEFQGRQEVQLNLVDVRSCESAAPSIQTRAPVKQPGIDRSQLGKIYKLLEQSANDNGLLPHKDSALLAKIIKMQQKDFDIAIVIFQELELLQVVDEKIKMLKPEAKKELASSPTYCAMQADGGNG